MVAYNNRSREKRPGQLRQIIEALGPAFGPALIMLAPEAYLSRISAGRSPFSPTLYKRRRDLTKPSLRGRQLSQEQYLRPTLYCDCHAPELIALADRFRANTRDDWDYALSIFDFVRSEIHYAIDFFPRSGAVGTLEMGCGLCTDKNNLLVALARAGGIRARYCQIGNFENSGWGNFPLIEGYINHFQTWELSTDWRLRNVGRGLMRRLRSLQEVGIQDSRGAASHVLAELKIGNSWILADPTLSDEAAVAHNMPLPRLGYDPIALTFGLRGNVIDRRDELQVRPNYWLKRWLFCVVARGLLDILNLAFEEKREEGRRLLAEVGEKDYMRGMRRFYVPLPQAAGLNMAQVT